MINKLSLLEFRSRYVSWLRAGCTTKTAAFASASNMFCLVHVQAVRQRAQTRGPCLTMCPEPGRPCGSNGGSV